MIYTQGTQSYEKIRVITSITSMFSLAQAYEYSILLSY